MIVYSFFFRFIVKALPLDAANSATCFFPFFIPFFVHRLCYIFCRHIAYVMVYKVRNENLVFVFEIRFSILFYLKARTVKDLAEKARDQLKQEAKEDAAL